MRICDKDLFGPHSSKDTSYFVLIGTFGSVLSLDTAEHDPVTVEYCVSKKGPAY